MFEVPKDKHFKMTDFIGLPQMNDPMDPYQVQYEIQQQYQAKAPRVNLFDLPLDPKETLESLGDEAVRLNCRIPDLKSK